MTNEKIFEFNTYLVDHAEELKKFSKDVNILTASALTQLQRLPISLRRRAASHNIRRLPHRFQKSAKVVAASKVSRKCRKYRRRHLNLKDVYAKRQSKNKWLFTHIWHAKRFKIINKWGWRIPNEPAQKCFRPSTKAMKNGCCVADISYFSTFEICGKVNKIIKYILRLINPDLVESSKKRIKDGKEVSFILYKPNSYPYTPIGPCKMMRINNDEEYSYYSLQNLSSILICVHPSITEETILALNMVFSFEEVHTNCWFSERKKTVMRNRSGEFCRFRLFGQLSQSIVTSFLEDSDQFEKLNKAPLNSVPREFVIQTSIKNLKSKRPLMKQTDIPICATYPVDSIQNFELGSSHFQSSPLILNAIKNKQASEAEGITKIDFDPIKEGDECFMILSRFHYLDEKAPGGWDMIIHAKWAMAMWITLIMKGCRPIGARYWSRFCALEATSLTAKNDCFPFYAWPDSVQGALESESKKDQQLLRWNRTPPAKRVNYKTNSTISPFICSWSMLMPDSKKPFFVMRDMKFLFRVANQILLGKVKPTLKDLNDFSPDAKYALIPVIMECSSTAAGNNSVLVAANLTDEFDMSIQQPPNNYELIRPLIGFIELGDQSIFIGRGRGFGFVSLYQMVKFCNSHKPFQNIWFKNNNSLTFSAGKLSLAI